MANRINVSKGTPHAAEAEHHEDFSIFDNKNISKKRVDLNDFGHFMKDKI